MADFTIYELNPTTRTAGSLLWIQVPSGAPSGYTDFRIDIDTLLATEQAAIAANASDITTNSDDISTLQAILNVDANLNVSGTGNRTLPPNGVIIEINITVVTGTSIDVKLGSTVGGDDIANYTGSKALSSGGYRRLTTTYRATVTAGSSPSAPIYFDVSGGSVHIHTFYRILTTT